MHSRKIVPLGEIAEEITVGYVGPMANEYVESGVPFLRSLNIKPFRFDPTELKFISSEFHHKIRKSALKPGDVAVVRTGNPGISCVIPEELADANCSDLVVIRPGEKLDPEFVSYYINSITKSHIKGQLVGAIQQHFNIGAAKEIHFPNISRQEQKSLSSTLTALDAKIALNQRINHELEGMAKLLYDYWFVQYDFPLSAAQAAALGQPRLTGQPYRSSGGPMVYQEQLKREIPKGWKVENILAVAELGGGATPSKKNANYWNGEIPFFTPTDATSEAFCIDTEDHITEEGLSNISTRLFSEGTLFITARGSVGKAMIISREMAMNQSCYALIPREGIGRAFLYYQTLSLMGFLHAKSSGSVFKSIVTNDIKFTPAIVPSPEVIQEFNKLAEPIFDQILNNQKQNQELTTLRDWLLPMLMNGQVRVG